MNAEPLTRTFSTAGPVRLYVENGAGSVEVTASTTDATRVRVTGARAGEVAIAHEDDRVSVVAPRGRAGFFGGDQRLRLEIELPLDSEVVVKGGSADVLVAGRTASARVKCGSGTVALDEVTGAVVVDTGSGDVRLAAAGELRVRSGSGDVEVARVAGAASLSSGTGDIRIGHAGAGVVVKTGSGDLEIAEAAGDVSSTTGSGDVLVRSARRGRISAKGASGDVRVGVLAGTPVWTDLSTVTGRVSSSLPPVGQPEPGADHVEVRVTTVSGDIALVPA